MTPDKECNKPQEKIHGEFCSFRGNNAPCKCPFKSQESDWIMEFETKIGGGLSSNPAFKALVLEFIRTLLTSEREKVLTEVQSVIEGYDRIKCGRCDSGDAQLHHILACTMRTDLLAKLEELKNKV